MNNWRLTADVYAIIPSGENRVYLAPTEKASYLNLVKKVAEQAERSTCEAERLESNEFKLKITNKVERDQSISRVFIKSSGFKRKNDWYELMNFDENYLVNILISIPNVKGDFGDEVFEAVFQLDNHKVSFTNSNLDNYKECLEEFRRKMSFELGTKTRKVIIGHRFDGDEETRYVLAEVKLRKDKPANSSFCTVESDMATGYLYVNKLPEGAKTVSDILRSGIIEPNCSTLANEDSTTIIKIARTNTSMVDSGEVLTNDFTGDIHDYRDVLVSNALSRIDSNAELIDNRILLSSAYEAFSIYSQTDLTKEKDLLEDVIKTNIFQTFLEFWDRGGISYGKTVGSAETDETNIKNVELSLILSIVDGNISKDTYYKDLFNACGVKLTEIITSGLKDWKELLMKTSANFDSFYKFASFFKLRQVRSDITFRQRVNSANYVLDVNTLASKFGEGSELRDAIIELADYAKYTSGQGVTSYHTYNVGTKKTPKIYISQEITLDDIIKFKKGVENISETLKNEIVKYSFVNCYLEYDNNGKLE